MEVCYNRYTAPSQRSFNADSLVNITFSLRRSPHLSTAVLAGKCRVVFVHGQVKSTKLSGLRGLRAQLRVPCINFRAGTTRLSVSRMLATATAKSSHHHHHHHHHHYHHQRPSRSRTPLCYLISFRSVLCGVTTSLTNSLCSPPNLFTVTSVDIREMSMGG